MSKDLSQLNQWNILECYLKTSVLIVRFRADLAGWIWLNQKTHILNLENPGFSKDNTQTFS